MAENWSDYLLTQKVSDLACQKLCSMLEENLGLFGSDLVRIYN